MNNQVALGGMNGIGDKKVSPAVHNIQRANPVLAVGRAAFNKLVSMNFGGFAKIIYDSYTYRKSTSITQWQNAIYNLGGSWKNFTEALTKGYNKKPFGLKLMPKQIKDLYKQKGVQISGIGVDPAIGTAVSAGTIILALIPLFRDILKKIPNKDMPQDSPPAGMSYEEYAGYETEEEEPTDSSKKANIGGIAAIGLGLLLFGMMSKGDKK